MKSLFHFFATFRRHFVPKAGFGVPSRLPKIDKRSTCGQKGSLGEHLQECFLSIWGAAAALHRVLDQQTVFFGNLRVISWATKLAQKIKRAFFWCRSRTSKTIVFPRKNNDFQEIACFCFDSFLSKHIPKTWRIQCWINDVTVFWKITKQSSPGIHFGSQNDPDLASEISKFQKNAPRRGFRVKSIFWSISELAKMPKKINQGHLKKVSHASPVSCATQKGIAPLVRGSPKGDRPASKGKSSPWP